MLSTSTRKVFANPCFLSLNAFRLSIADLSRLLGLLDGLLRGETDGEISESLSSRIVNCFRRVVFGVFSGEWVSYQSLITS